MHFNSFNIVFQRHSPVRKYCQPPPPILVYDSHAASNQAQSVPVLKWSEPKKFASGGQSHQIPDIRCRVRSTEAGRLCCHPACKSHEEVLVANKSPHPNRQTVPFVTLSNWHFDLFAVCDIVLDSYILLKLAADDLQEAT